MHDSGDRAFIQVRERARFTPALAQRSGCLDFPGYKAHKGVVAACYRTGSKPRGVSRRNQRVLCAEP